MGPRLNRLFAADGRCFDVAVDHGFFGEEQFLAGIEDIEETIVTLAAAGPDAIQLSPGQAPILQALPGAKPALVLRVDVGNVYGAEPSRHLFNELVADAVETAVRLDAACVCANLLRIEGEPEVHHQCVHNVTTLRAACDRYAMPLMVEPLVFGAGSGDAVQIATLVRQAVELGADVIKTDPSDDLDAYERVLEVARPRPLLVRGGGRMPEEELLRMTERLMELGASGIVYGRNVIQHDDPAAITRKLMEIVHG
ncbi:MAG: class I fructose-bisphosphate aldolase [Gaiellaceae bacterium]